MTRLAKISLLVLGALSALAVLYFFAVPKTGAFHRAVNDHSPNIAKPLVLTFDELSRSSHASDVRVTFTSGTSVASALWVVSCNVELAEERGAKYFVELRSWMEHGGSSRSIVGFSDQPHPDPASYFGVHDANPGPLRWFSVDEFRQAFPRRAPAESEVQPSR